ncbi:DUF2066 domain-containing protein [Alteromonas mediterranea]|uniref:DUF2066 domain-containing protein n=1 Tax=Alteromonas mediterranea TaxID=314275 RepID=A0AAC8XKM7_9ALTE|nr:DUF2066 domain-containing protein [Alteromonas mediterranea]AFV85755.1 hypothetical protein amad1_11250 [Alteromonas mediterranea DE1]AGP97768.1 hypothetical protein I635_11240 [Alteromonas mediterranea UM7]AGQ02015.1 hypothetical protein I636_10815 [Alteromonas mediterranea UM4b]AMJ78796.1 hypothetical protein AV942_11105 [Alteromonas mediterranea]AMJ82945.1 hypothetical protein AV941_11140 [Alteromonas mediterranea]
MLTAVKRNTKKANTKGRRFTSAIGLSLIALLNYSAFTFAAQRVVVSEAQIQVDDQSQRTQQAALKKALRQVFIKMSGSTHVLDNAGVRAALSSPQSLLRSYRFAYENGQTYYVAEFDQAKLNEILQREMLPLWGDRRPETIVWLVEEGENETRSILDESVNTELQLALKKTAKERGVPLSLPLMDLTDNVNISTYDVWGRFVEPLRQASVRYNIDNIIGARVYPNDPSAIPDLPENAVPSGTVESLDDVLSKESQDTMSEMGADATVTGDSAEGYSHQSAMSRSTPSTLLGAEGEAQSEANGDDTESNGNVSNSEQAFDAALNNRDDSAVPFTMNEFADYAKRADEGKYALDWVFVGGGKVSYGSIYGDSPQALGKQLIDAYSNYLSSLYAVVGIEVSEREVITVSIANIGSINSYASATDYLNSLSVIESATLVEQSGTVATYSLTLVGTVDDLLNSIQLEGRLLSVTDAYGQTVKGHSFYWSN